MLLYKHAPEKSIFTLPIQIVLFLSARYQTKDLCMLDQHFTTKLHPQSQVFCFIFHTEPLIITQSEL
jgi:hypothetical protein